MNKKFLSGILCGALLIASASAFVSCKDYDDDIQGLQNQIDNNKKGDDQKIADLTKVVEDNLKTVQGQIAALDAQIKAAAAANEDAHNALAALIEAEAAARVAADEAAKAYTDAQAKAAKDAANAYTDAAKAEALAAAKAASDAAQKFADDAAAALAAAEANAAATYATKAELEAARANLQAGLDKAQADATSALQKYDELSAELTKKVAELKAAYEAADEKLKEQLQNDIADLKAELAVQVGKLADADAALETKITEANGKIEAAEGEIKDLKTRVATLESQLKNLNEVEIPAVKQEIAAAKKELEESIAALSKKQGDDVKDLQDAISALKETIALTDKTAAALRSDLTALQELVNNLKNRVADMEGAIVAVKNDLAAHIVLFNAFKAETEDNIIAIWDSIAGLDARCVAIEAEAAALSGSLDDTKAALQTLAEKEGKDVADILAKIATEKADVLSTLRAELATAKGELTEAYIAADKELKNYVDEVKTYLQGQIATAITTCNAYTDAQIAALKQYVDAQDLSNRGYTDQQIASLKSTLESAIAYGDAQTLGSAKDYTDDEIAELFDTFSQMLAAEVDARNAAIDALGQKLTTEYQAADAKVLSDSKAYADAQIAFLKSTLEKAIKDGDDAVAAAAQAALDAVEAALTQSIADTKADLQGKIDALNAALNALKDKEAADFQTLTESLNNAVENLKGLIAAGDADLLEKINKNSERLTTCENNILALQGEVANLKSDLYNLITQIVYQGSNTSGNHTCDPIVKGDEPVIYYAQSTAAHDAWPKATVKGHAPAVTAGQCVFQYQKGNFYATVNPSNVDLSGKVILDLENSNGEKNKYFKLGALEASDALITKAGSTGLYKMKLLPTDDFNFDAIKADKVLYAMAANWTNKEGQDVKVSASYGLDNFENYCEVYPSAKPGKKALPEFKFYTDDTYASVQGKNDMFSNYEYSVATTTEFPTAYLKLDNEIAQWNYKWYVEFFEYTDNAYTPAGSIDLAKKGASIDPTTLFADYEDEALDSITYTKSFTLADANYINKRILVKVSAINYNYEEQVAYTILSFTRPLFDEVSLTNQFYPGNKTAQKLYFYQQLKDSLTQAGVDKYNAYANVNGAQFKSISFPGTAFDPTSFDPKTLTSIDEIVYEPVYVDYAANELKDNVIDMEIVDDAFHKIIDLKVNAQIKTPKHLDYQIVNNSGVQNRIPASFNFKHNVTVGGETQSIQFYPDEQNKNMILVWPSVASVVYDLKGAFTKLNAEVENNPFGSANPWFTGGWQASNGSIFLFTSASTDLTVDNTVAGQKVTVNDNTKSMSVFANEKVAAQFSATDKYTATTLRPYELSRRISYYNCGMDDRYFSDAADKFSMTFASPINYGLFRAASDVENGNTFTIEYSLVKGANTITFENVFPDYSVITSGDPVKFGLTDARITSATFEITAAGKSIPEYSYLETPSYDPATKTFSFTYTNTAAITTFTLPCELTVTDIWGITTSFSFNLKFLPNKL